MSSPATDSAAVFRRWGGVSCNKCVRSCKEHQFTGKRDDEACKCECRPGNLGTNCELRIHVVESSTEAGKPITITYNGPGLKPDDQVLAFKSDVTNPWSAKDGWAQAAGRGRVCGELRGCHSSKGSAFIKGCKCDASCATCGYRSSPTGADDCITCPNGKHLNKQYSDGTGSCETEEDK